MTPETFKAIRKEAGLTQSGLAALLGISDSRAIRRWEAGDRPISGPVSLLMLAIDRRLIDLCELEDLRGFSNSDN
jgi:DNA-binding transcriptional regulator YiaG